MKGILLERRTTYHMTQTKIPSYSFRIRETIKAPKARYLWLFPLLVLLCAECMMLFINAVLPLQGMWFYDSLLRQIAPWTLWPTHLLFPHLQLTAGLTLRKLLLSVGSAWKETYLLFGTFTLLFLVYLVAVYALPRRITWRYIFCSTILLGVTLTFCAAIASQDIFSYIAYARMEVFYHLNPFTHLPTEIRSDPVSTSVFWKRQSSLYGPVWILIVSGIQWLASAWGFNSVPAMVLLLRLFSLVMHLASAALIWSIIGHWQKKELFPFPLSQTRRLQATLAFAWNPLLLFEACVNAHSDTTVLFLLLFTLWLLIPRPQTAYYASFLAVAVFAIAICLKANFFLLLPGIFLFLFWTQFTEASWWLRIGNIILHAGVSAVVILLLYLPFWQHGEIIRVLLSNPNTAHDANSLYEVFLRLYSGLAKIQVPSATVTKSILVETISHTASTLVFLVVYVALCVRALITSRSINTLPALVRWMTLVWFSYCLFGTPWFWPWYMITFFGLFALVEGSDPSSNTWFQLLNVPFAVRVFAFTMLSVYCFYTWAPYASFFPYIFHAQWVYLRGLWAWFLPLLILCLYPYIRRRRQKAIHSTSVDALLPVS